jgi:hypothetical protein
LRQLEEVLMRPAVRRSQELLTYLLAEDFCEIGGSGALLGKKQTIRNLRKEMPCQYFLQDFHLLRLAPEVVLTTYRATCKGALGRVRHFLQSSIWQRQSGHWRLVFHQGTQCGGLVH